MAKRIGIISDTHGLLRPEVISILKTCDCILHAGDVDRPEILDQLRYLGSLYVCLLYTSHPYITYVPRPELSDAGPFHGKK